MPINNTKYNIFRLGYIFLPFLSFLFALKHYKEPWFKNALWLFIIFFGFSMSYLETIDAYAYRLAFEDFVRFNDLENILDVFDPSKTGRIDFARPLINFLIAPFTSSYHFLFGLYALIFGYFYSRNIDFILKEIRSPRANSVLGIVFFLAIYIGFWNINGFRFWTACHIFIFGVIHFIYKDNKRKGILFMALSLAFHLSFLFAIIVFLISRYIPKFPKLFIIITLVFTVYNPINNLQVVQSYLIPYTFNQQLEKKVTDYTSEEMVERAENTSYNTSLFKIASKFFITTFILSLAWFLTSKLKLLNDSEVRMVNFGLILSLISAILSFVPSLGTRFSVIGLFLLLYGIFVVLMRQDYFPSRKKVISTLGFLCSALFISSNIWISFTFSAHTLFGNYFTILADSSDVFYSIGDLIKYILI